MASRTLKTINNALDTLGAVASIVIPESLQDRLWMVRAQTEAVEAGGAIPDLNRNKRVVKAMMRFSPRRNQSAIYRAGWELAITRLRAGQKVVPDDPRGWGGALFDLVVPRRMLDIQPYLSQERDRWEEEALRLWVEAE